VPRHRASSAPLASTDCGSYGVHGGHWTRIQRPHSFLHSYRHASNNCIAVLVGAQTWRLTSCMPPLVWSAVHASSTVACRDSYILNYIGLMYRVGRARSSSASWCSTVCTTKHPSTSSTSASLYPLSLPDNTFALPTEVFPSCLAIVSAVTVGGLLPWPALWYGTGYQTVWETRLSAETPSDVHWRRFYVQLTCVHSALELFGRCAVQIYLLTYLLTRCSCLTDCVISVKRIHSFFHSFIHSFICSIENLRSFICDVFHTVRVRFTCGKWRVRNAFSLGIW